MEASQNFLSLCSHAAAILGQRLCCPPCSFSPRGTVTKLSSMCLSRHRCSNLSAISHRDFFPPSHKPGPFFLDIRVTLLLASLHSIKPAVLWPGHLMRGKLQRLLSAPTTPAPLPQLIAQAVLPQHTVRPLCGDSPGLLYHIQCHLQEASQPRGCPMTPQRATAAPLTGAPPTPVSSQSALLFAYIPEFLPCGPCMCTQSCIKMHTYAG